MSSSTGLNPNTEPQVQTTASSQSRLRHFSHTWTIDNFSVRPKLESATISFCPENELRFILVIYPNGKTEESKGYLSIFLLNTHPHSYYNNFIGCKFAILNDKGNKCNVQDIQDELYCPTIFGPNIIYALKEIGFEKYISRNELFSPSNGLLPNNKLTIYVEISYLIDQKTIVSSPYNPASIESVLEKEVLEDYAKLLKSGDLSDVVLIVSGTEFRAHKNILAARSPVFRAMFKHDLMEKQQNRVEILDVKSEVFQLLLSYIYTGKIDSIEGNAEDLLAAADKYELIALKSHCEQYLFTKVSVESAPNLLMLSDSYNAHKLKTNVLDFIKSQSQETFQAIVKANPELLVDMFRYLAIKSEQLEK